MKKFIFLVLKDNNRLLETKKNIFLWDTVVRGQDRQIINSKNKNRILGKNIFSNFFFLHGEKENFEEYSLYLESTEFSFATLINYLTSKCRTCPRSTVWNEPLQNLVFRWVRYLSTKSHTYKTYGILRFLFFFIRRFVETHIQRLFFDYQKDILFYFILLKILIESLCFSTSFAHSFECFWKKNQNLKFWWHFKVLEVNCFWVDSATLTMVESMPKAMLKS
jgi:hypothetical protein